MEEVEKMIVGKADKWAVKAIITGGGGSGGNVFQNESGWIEGQSCH